MSAGNHTPDCAFNVSFGDLVCDCNGPPEGPQPEPGTRTATAREHLAIARAALGRSRNEETDSVRPRT